MSTVPKFSLDKPRYNLNTYAGRVRHFVEITDPFLLATSDAKLKQAQDLLAAFKNGELPAGTTDQQLWEARRIKEGIIHPDTGAKIFPAFRMSSFVPANIPICAGMVLLPATTFNMVFWQWVNQTYNAGFNYANRNASGGEGETNQIVQSYVAATTIACSVALGLNRWVKNAKGMTATVRTLVEKTVPFVAVATAGASNALLMRYREGIDGVTLLDHDGKEYGASVTAGRYGLAQVAATRVALPLPILLLPPYILQFLHARAFMKRTPIIHKPVELAVITLCLWVCFPAAIGLFPQQAEIPASWVEPQFQGKLDRRGAPITSFYFNKGI